MTKVLCNKSDEHCGHQKHIKIRGAFFFIHKLEEH